MSETIESNIGADFLSATEISKLFGIGIRTFRRWTADGTFPTPDIRVGKIQRWSKETLQNWIDEQKDA